MADLKISELRPLTDAQVVAADLVPVADVSATETRKITIADHAKAMVRLVPDGSMPFDKIDPTTFDLPDGSVDTPELADGAVTHPKLAADAVEADNIADNAVTAGKIGPGAVQADALANNAVTADKVAVNAVENDNVVDGAITVPKIDPNSYDRGVNAATGRIGIANTVIAGTHLGIQYNEQGLITDVTELPDGSIETDDLEDGSVTNEKLAENSVDTLNIIDGSVTGTKISPTAFNRGIDSTAGVIGITNGVVPGTHAGISYDEQGLITGTTALIPPTDLPVATTNEVGAVSVPLDGGLSVAGTGAVSIGNDITPGTSAKVTFDQHGLVTAGEDLEPGDLPVATATALGAVNVPADGGLSINAGAVRMQTTGVTAPGPYTKIQCNEFGAITNGSSLITGDIPGLPADKIVSGQFPNERLADDAVTGRNISDYATCLMQESNPGKGDFLGQLWFTPSTAQLRIYARGSGSQDLWSPVGFGNLQANNLRWGGTYNAETNTIVTVTSIGTSEGLIAGEPFPVPSDSLSGLYLVCAVGGANTTQPQLNGVTSTPGDWALCLDASQGWNHIDASAGGGGGGGGASSLNDLLDVELGGSAPFAVGAMENGSVKSALEDRNLFKYDGKSGVWKNTNLIDCGTF